MFQTLKRISPWHSAGTGGSDEEDKLTKRGPDSPITGEIITNVDRLDKITGNAVAGTDLIVWKATREGVAKLRIPEGADIVASMNMQNKCRASQAEVLALFEIEWDIEIPPFSTQNIEDCILDGQWELKGDKSYIHSSIYDKHFAYAIEKTATPTSEFDKSMKACSSGIHFFPQKKNAVLWHAMRAPGDPPI
jgi:hypothetical protein